MVAFRMEPTPEDLDNKKNNFQEFCQQTSLHGWQHIQRVNTIKGRVVWFSIVLASLAVASLFLATAAKDFVLRSVVTTIETTTGPLQDVFFPTVIVCNINQVRRSLFQALGATNESDINLLYRQFFTGMERNLTQEEEAFILQIATSELMVKRLIKHWKLYSKENSTQVNTSSIDWKGFLANNTNFIHNFDFVKDMAVDDPGDSPIVTARWGGKMLRENATDFMPFFGTDLGFCSLVKPQLTFNPEYDHLPFARKLYGVPKGQNESYSRLIKPGVKVGKANGLRLLLDAQTFDYTFHKSASEGFKIAVQHHLDQPLMSVKELDIATGFETQIAVTPVIYNTTQAALHRFTPQERGCYSEDEMTFKYLPKSLYRYDISNCLFEATYEKVLEECNCTPYFHWAGLKEYQNFCRGSSLICMNEIFSRLGEFNDVLHFNENGKASNYKVSDKNAPRRKCLAACENQINEISITSSRLPNRQTFMDWPDFCLVVVKIRNACQGWKRQDLDSIYPRMCQELTTTYADVSIDILCKQIHKNSKELANTLERYARDNLALVNMYIKPPVVTKILRDQRIPIIWFVANCGGILGLCMGFSIVTVFEVLHCICKMSLSSLEHWLRQSIWCRRFFKKSASASVSDNANGTTTQMTSNQLTTQSTFNGSINTTGMQRNSDEVAIRMEHNPEDHNTEHEERAKMDSEKAQFL